ncbi:2TM domain-containing protein [Flavobacterium channae]|uniref:2TM domain-containing protein n=1 Tax=Flavobacterium channae TaxID=2897181 RepID=UPI001E4E4F53|nr:2TM domain-containing protein [Flavobacterium channae]UGS24320.1 2TM domain-containing protein [Flavobacterium channae]
MKIISYLIKGIIKGLVVSFVLFFVIIGIQYFFGRIVKLNSNLVTEFTYYVVYGVVLSIINSAYFDFLNQKLNWDKLIILKKYRIVIGFIGSIFVTILGIFFIRFSIKVLIEGSSIDHFFENENKAHYLVSLIITIIVSIVFHLIYFYKAYQENKVKEQKIIAGTASAQFESLKNQIDPHFLFNSLNVLSSLIEENPESAQKFTTSLSKIYRYVLEQKDKELVSVAEELQFAKTYMNLLKMRFENSITFEIPEGFDNEEAKVVPLSLQLLLENCIKHNVVSEAKPLHVKISIENGQLVISNNLQKKEVLQDRKGVGLQNIVNRYGILTKRKVLVEENEKEFKIFLPILTKQITIMETQNIYNENLAYQRAKDKVEQLKGFYGNLISYCIVIPFLIFINLRTSNFQWFWFPMLGWGMGLTFHALETFGYGKSWEERKINELMNKDDNSKIWK